jgi:3-deoxy-D-arabino-heptulosonate 7-phosphate (DAHP) synthase
VTLAARVFTPRPDGSCQVCGLYADAHSHAPACPVTANSLTFDQILDAAAARIVSYLLAWDALSDRNTETQSAREQIAAALRGQ